MNVDNQRICERLYRNSYREGTNAEGQRSDDGNILNVPEVDIADVEDGEVLKKSRRVDLRSGGIIRSGVLSTGRKKFTRRKKERVKASQFRLTDTGPSKRVDRTRLLSELERVKEGFRICQVLMN